MNNRVVTSELENSCGLHTADSAADNVNSLGRIGLFNVVLVPLHRFGVNRTACKVETVGKFLIVGNSLVVAHIETAVVAEDTRTDIVLLIVDHLCYPRLIRKERTGKARAVYLSVLNGVCRNSRVKTTCADNGDIDKILYVFNIGKVAVFGHINRRMSPVPCVVCTVVAVEAVIACVLEEFCSLFGFLHITADFNIVLAGDCTLTEALSLGNDAVTQRNREIVAANLFDGLNNLCRKTVTVLKTSAVLIGTLVDIFKCELIKKITLVNGMNFNSVNACILKELCCFCKSVNHFPDLVLCHRS